MDVLHHCYIDATRRNTSDHSASHHHTTSHLYTTRYNLNYHGSMQRDRNAQRQGRVRTKNYYDTTCDNDYFDATYYNYCSRVPRVTPSWFSTRSCRHACRPSCRPTRG